MTKNYFYHGYQHPIWPKKDKNWVYFGPFRPKIDPKMVSYKITFTKKWFFITTFHLFTQIRIILDHQVWDHFSNKRNLNKQIWVFWAPVLEKKSNRVPKNIFFLMDSMSGFSLPYVILANFRQLKLFSMLIYKLQRVARVSLTFKSEKVYHNIVFLQQLPHFRPIDGFCTTSLDMPIIDGLCTTSLDMPHLGTEYSNARGSAESAIHLFLPS